MVVFVAAVAALLIGSIAFSVSTSFNDKEYVVTVTGKDRITEQVKDSDGKYETKSKYLVFADGGDGSSLVFENTDNWMRRKFNSSNVQGQLKEGHTYKVTVVGIRFAPLSWYENILKAEEMK